MAFLSILLLAIAGLVIQISNIYNKGVSLKAVNQAGTSLVADLQSQLNQTDSIDDADIVYFNKDLSNPVAGEEVDVNNLNNSGRLCTGSITFAWNSGKFVGNTTTNETINHYDDADRGTDIRFISVPDSTRKYCQNDGGSYLDIPKNDATELLSTGDRNLVVHDLLIKASHPEIDEAQTIVLMKLRIGTKNDDSIDSNGACKPPADNSAQDYCAVNTFTFTARLGGVR